METLRSLIAGQLPPAGEPIVWAAPDVYEPEPQFPGYQATWVDSGTSALALALLALRQRRPDVTQPEVIVPAYGCPDLVAAAVHGGLKPVAVDIGRADPGYDLTQLVQQISRHTLAVVAVNFLGIREPLEVLSRRLQDYPWVTLIEDNAQWFPQAPETGYLFGDMVIFSFGRGKPVSLLGGGGLLYRPKLAQWIPNIPSPENAGPGLAQFKYLAYNLLLKPRFYQLLNRAPFIKLGETRYQPLDTVHKLDLYRTRLLAANIRTYRSSIPPAADAYETLLKEYNGLAALESGRRMRLLRYPIVCKSSSERDRLLRTLTRQGLGASAMYQRPLAQIPGVARHLSNTQQLPNAVDFADRLLTLPVHRGVTEHHWRKIAKTFHEGATPY